MNWEIRLDFYHRCPEFLSQHGTIVVVSLVEIKGSAPQQVGAKMIVSSQGEWLWGTVGGGKVEAAALTFSQDLVKATKSTDMVEWNLQKDIGMTCGGQVRLFFEVLKEDQWSVVLFGAGHISQALVSVLLPLGCKIECIDHRQEWLERLPVHPGLKGIKLDSYRDYVPEISDQAYVLSLTMGHSTDLPVLAEVLKSPRPYVGGIGSEIKARKLKVGLKESGLSEEQIAPLHCPVGLPFGDNSPEQIAISIAAQMLTVKSPG